MRNGSSFDPSNKDRLFHLPNGHMGVAKGIALGKVRLQTQNLDVAATKAMGEV